MKSNQIVSVKLRDGTELIFDNKYYTIPAYQEWLEKIDIKVSKTWLTKLANEKEIETLPIVQKEDTLKKLYVIINNSHNFYRLAKTGDYIGFHGGAENANKQGSKVNKSEEEPTKKDK